MNKYQQHLTTPDAFTAAWQEQLNDWGFKDASGANLKADGVCGPKTDAVTKNFENGFFDGFTGGANQKSTVQTKTFPTIASDEQIKASVTPVDYNTTGAEWQQSHAIGKSALAAPLASAAYKPAQPLQNQKNAYGTQTTAAPYRLDTAQFKNTEEQIKPYTAGMDLGLQKVLDMGADAQKNTGFKDEGYRLPENWRDAVQQYFMPANGGAKDGFTPVSAKYSATASAESDSNNTAGANKIEPEGTQLNPDGTWKQVAVPGAWNRSGGEYSAVINNKLYELHSEETADVYKSGKITDVDTSFILDTMRRLIEKANEKNADLWRI